MHGCATSSLQRIQCQRFVSRAIRETLFFFSGVRVGTGRLADCILPPMWRAGSDLVVPTSGAEPHRSGAAR